MSTVFRVGPTGPGISIAAPGESNVPAMSQVDATVNLGDAAAFGWANLRIIDGTGGCGRSPAMITSTSRLLLCRAAASTLVIVRRQVRREQADCR